MVLESSTSVYKHFFKSENFQHICQSTSFLSAPGHTSVGVLLTEHENKSRQSFSFFFKLIFIRVELLYNVVLVSAVQQSESAIRIHISPLFWISFPFRST